jgi:hypothetical protein
MRYEYNGGWGCELGCPREGLRGRKWMLFINCDKFEKKGKFTGKNIPWY